MRNLSGLVGEGSNPIIQLNGFLPSLIDLSRTHVQPSRRAIHKAGTKQHSVRHATCQQRVQSRSDYSEVSEWDLGVLSLRKEHTLYSSLVSSSGWYAARTEGR